jgi:hypothetical protein
VRDFRQRIRLVHELGELAGAEELLHGGDDGLAVDEVVRLQRVVGILRHGELLLDGALHADETHAEAVLQEFTHGPDPAVAQVVDIVLAHRRHFVRAVGTRGVVLLQAQQVVDGLDEVLGAQGAEIQLRAGAQLGVHLVAADLGKIVLLVIEEHGVQQLLAGLQSGGFTGPDLLEELLGGFFGILRVVLGECLAQDLARGIQIREGDDEVADIVGQEHFQVGLEEGIVGLQQHLAGVHVDHVFQQDGAIEHGALHVDALQPGLLHLLHETTTDGLALLGDDFLALGILDVLKCFLTHKQLAGGKQEVFLLEREMVGRIEMRKDRLIVREALVEEP